MDTTSNVLITQYGIYLRSARCTVCGFAVEKGDKPVTHHEDDAVIADAIEHVIDAGHKVTVTTETLADYWIDKIHP